MYLTERNKQELANNAHKNSEAVIHEEQRSPQKKEEMHGYEQNTSEKDSDTYAHELVCAHNAYNNVSVGADKKGDIVIAGSAIKRANSPTLDSDRKRLRISRAGKKRCFEGELITSSRLPRTGAFAFKANKKVPEKRMLVLLREHSRRLKISSAEDIMPFMSVDRDMSELSRLREESAPQSEIMALERTISDKNAAMHRFLRMLKAAGRKANEAVLIEYNSGKMSSARTGRSGSKAGAIPVQRGIRSPRRTERGKAAPCRVK